MGLHTDYLGSLRIEPPLSPAEVDVLKGFSRTRHCGDRGPLDVITHPSDDDPPADTASYNRVSAGMPGLWCPWSCCDEGCCLRWDRVEKPYAPDRWLRYLIDTFLRPGAALAADPAARATGLTFDHVLRGTIVGERRETGELFGLSVQDNRVRRPHARPAARRRRRVRLRKLGPGSGGAGRLPGRPPRAVRDCDRGGPAAGGDSRGAVSSYAGMPASVHAWHR